MEWQMQWEGDRYNVTPGRIDLGMADGRSVTTKKMPPNHDVYRRLREAEEGCKEERFVRILITGRHRW